MNKLIYNYHTHTKRCGHAFGEDEEYVVKAIELGIKRLAFSDHVILPKGYEQKGIRGSYYELEDYLTSINYLKEKYKNQIEIKVGFEAEYYPSMFDYYQSLLKDKIDFLILGQHCYLNDEDKFSWYFKKDSSIKDIHHYIDDVINGIESGLFKYVCHPDLFMHSQYEWNEELTRESQRLLEKCADFDIPIELNICGMRKTNYNEEHYSYPNINFFKLVSKYKVKVVLGIDAHDPSHFNQKDIDAAIDFANRCGLTIDWDYSI